MTNYYYDYLVDCVLLIGANELSGIIPPQHSVPDDNTDHYQQQILAAISATVALFPFSKTSAHYPPDEFRKSTDTCDSKPPKRKLKPCEISKSELQTIHDLVTQFNKTEIHDTTTVASISRRNSKYRSKRRSIKKIPFDDLNGAWGSVSTDTIKSFPAIYFHNNLRVLPAYVGPQIKFLPLTDNMGNRSYAIRMEFCRKFAVALKYGDEKSTTVIIEKVKKENEYFTEIVYVPSNIVLFSKYPYFDLFRHILSRLYKRIHRADTPTIEQELLEFSSILTRIPVLKSSTIQLTFSINDDSFSIKPTVPFYQEIIDWDLTILFQILSIDDIITILLAMFQEKQIVFLANDTNVITLTTETLLLLFRPFQWKHFYLTTTPAHLYDLVDAIVPFMLGLPHYMKSKLIEYYPDIIIVDLEKGTLTIPSSCQLKYVSRHLTDQITQHLQCRDWLNSVESVSSLLPLSYEETKQRSDSFNWHFTGKILTIFMTFMVDLFQDVIGTVAIEKRDCEVIFANLDKFLAMSQNQNLEFFKEIQKTDGFNCFIDDKLNKKILDGWMKIYNKRYPDLGKYPKISRSTNDSRTKGVVIDFSSLLESENEHQEIVFPSSKKIRSCFYQDLMSNINALDNTFDIRKLRAEMFLQSGDPVAALAEFYKILLINPTEVTHTKLRKIIRGIGKNNLSRLKTLEFQTNLFEIIDFDERRDTVTLNYERHKIKQYTPPSAALDKSDFVDECRNSNISEYEDAVIVLFYCLTIDSKPKKESVKTVNPEIFKCFYNSWINSSPDLCDVEMSLGFVDEILIKSTETCVRVDGHGLGRVILTQYRLFFIPFRKSCCDVICNFNDTTLLKVKIDRRIKGFGKVTEVLELVFKEKESKSVWLLHDTNTWHQLISEINVTHQLALLEKDKTLLSVVTDRCLMFENIVNCAKKNSFFKTNLHDIRKKLLVNSAKKYIVSRNKNDEHRKYLIAKLTPVLKHSVTIESSLEMYSDNCVELWCVCKYREKYFVSILQISNDMSYSVLDRTIDLPIPVLSLIRVPTSDKIIACCKSHFIIVLDRQNHQIEKQIPLPIDKGSYPVCGACSRDGRGSVYFGTTNGEILSWNYQTNEVKPISKLINGDPVKSLHLYDCVTLIVGSIYRFYFIKTNGEIVSNVAISEYMNKMTTMSCLNPIRNNSTILSGLSRVPVVIEHDIRDALNVVCMRRRNLFTNKEFNVSDISETHEPLTTFVGIVSILMVKDDSNRKLLWIMLKDGTIEIRDYNTLETIGKFTAHVDSISHGILCQIGTHQFVISIGREEGKVGVWSIHPLLPLCETLKK